MEKFECDLDSSHMDSIKTLEVDASFDESDDVISSVSSQFLCLVSIFLISKL